MSAIKDGRLPIMLDKERHLLFNLDALDEFQDRMSGYGEFEKILSDKKLLGWLLTLLLNKGADEMEESLTEIKVEKLIHQENINEIKVSVLKALVKGMIGDNEPENAEDEWNVDKHRVGAGKIDVARLLYIGVFILNFPERDVWKMTVYKLMTLFKLHRSSPFLSQRMSGQGFPYRDMKMDCEDDIDYALGGL